MRYMYGGAEHLGELKDILPLFVLSKVLEIDGLHQELIKRMEPAELTAAFSFAVEANDFVEANNIRRVLIKRKSRLDPVSYLRTNVFVEWLERQDQGFSFPLQKFERIAEWIRSSIKKLPNNSTLAEDCGLLALQVVRILAQKHLYRFTGTSLLLQAVISDFLRDFVPDPLLRLAIMKEMEIGNSKYPPLKNSYT